MSKNRSALKKTCVSLPCKVTDTRKEKKEPIIIQSCMDESVKWHNIYWMRWEEVSPMETCRFYLFYFTHALSVYNICTHDYFDHFKV